ncbi:MAG TPA: NAD(P)/FAD-dependent oxidoreductase [Candidatus Saccharimonadales bacterium]|nr:NAD(P)/FAD-dependent oxidoreductase [Candidatus Saccharimonadales bacterium]
MSQYDLIVVGAGPAGSGTAGTAAKLGLKTLLLEKDRLPRDKLCGGGVTPKVLNLLDFKLPDELIERRVKSVRIHTEDHEYRFQKGSTIAYMTSRSKFDHFLAQRAVDNGVELLDANPVYGIDSTDTGLEVKTRNGVFHSKMLVGADGIGGPSARQGKFYERWQPDQVAYAIESEIPVGEKAVEEFIGPEQYFDIYFGVSTSGYGWIFPKNDHLTVGIGCRLNRLRDARALFYDFVKRITKLIDIEIPKPQAHLVPIGGAAKVPLVRDRILLAGDAGGFAEPLLGEGIYFSILGGQIAAKVCSEAVSKNRFDAEFLSVYKSLCQEAFLKDFDIAYWLARMSYLEQYNMDSFSKFFLGEKTVQECIIGLLDGSITYRDAQRKLTWPYFKYRLARLGIPFYS